MGTPKNIEFIGLAKSFPAFPTADPALSYAAVSITHEAFHTVNVYHHGEGDSTVVWTRGPGNTVLENYNTPIRVKREDETDVTTAVLADIDSAMAAGRLLGKILGRKGGLYSGVEKCVMRYDDAGAYISDKTPSDRYAVSETPGALLCNTPAGTGVNEPPPGHTPQSRYGPAAKAGENVIADRGNCQGQIRVNDLGAAPLR